jgi:hypothetical protein
MSDRRKTQEATLVLPLSSLMEDMDLYPRHSIDSTYVASLLEALKAGDQLPPIIIDKKSLRIVDGWHRARAYKRLHGASGSIDVITVQYKSEADIIFDAVKRNAGHGREELCALRNTLNTFLSKLCD